MSAVKNPDLCFKCCNVALLKSNSFFHALWKKENIFTWMYTQSDPYTGKIGGGGLRSREDEGGLQGGGEFCTTLLQLHLHWRPCGYKSESGSRLSPTDFSPLYILALSRHDCQFLTWTHMIFTRKFRF
ncbi:hypothetical protein ILYODFUR_001750 [Ilyodon furcidens]|uniref:Uncharacterized protein n=1 Tax=Ilyodon furcidens TaxID=33524 RepID=A0ABV0SUV9_9TELE